MYAFVLRRSNLRENDQLVSLYTWEKGKIEALVRGVKKITSKNSAYLEPFFLIEAEVVPGKEVNHLTKAVPFFCYKNIFKDLEKLILVRTAFSWLSVLTHNNERDSKVFLLIKSWLEFLDHADQSPTALGYSLLANLVAALGFAPSLISCALCNEKNNLVGFFPSGGGVICRTCFLIKKQQAVKVYPIRTIDLQALQWLFSNQWNKAVEYNTEIANRLVFLYAQYHSEKKLIKISTLI